MSVLSARYLSTIDRQVVEAIVTKYGLGELEATRSFLQSETYQMLLDERTGVYEMSPLIMFDM